MSENIELSYIWDHTGNTIKEWVIFNKLEGFNSLLKYTDDNFTPTGKLCYINENGEKLHKRTYEAIFQPQMVYTTSH